ncbi:peptidoglycan bridge formation glycyltransferase FemA/FemB family protein [Roseivirga sp. UBA838]|uniref:peptidoglycan bridge formation glycyltransferase FemA/FemB family protein n=1 Tax=Roseivirga sp. UBA838 TaxID=1947393 RepID=UPI00257B354C|nr:peptidoglycan bridge formation glycyltransferase FemA/FemB family protein [Roseivirga sp. UBA838]|tara:strand:- start:47765 stop:48790 length:1026 start_codon:yes stop_codon:yes gene_type:complete
MEIKFLTSELHDEYEEFVSNDPNSLIYHSVKFKRFLESLLGCRAHYIVALDKRKVVGVLPLMVANGPLGKVVNSLPFYGSNGGVLAKSVEVANELIEKYSHFLVENNIAASTIVENPLDREYNYLQLKADENDYRIGQFTKIEGMFNDLEELMTLFHFKTRNTIRKSIKSGVFVGVENDAFQFLEETHKENMVSIGGLAKPPKFFQTIQEVFESDKDYRIYIARYEGAPIAALLVLYYNQCVEYYTPVVVKEFRHLQALSLIICTAMLDASKEGFEMWNWGGTWPSQDGVYQFKSRWGTEDYRYDYYINIRNMDIYKADRKMLLEEYAGFYVLPFDKLCSK